ncbi:hypothetical protein ACHAXN_011723 [Cyclotella atomus]
MASADRNAEIWATRLQREILALESSDDESKKMELLPPFIKTLGHTLNIEGGIAKIEFRIDVEVAEQETTADAESVEEKEVKENATAGDESKITSNAADTNDVTKEEADAAKPETEETVAATEPSENKKETESTNVPTETITDPHVILVLDASMYWKTHDTDTDSKSPQFYPFTKPLAVIKSGSNLFSGGSTISNGDEVDIDLDWTPSIHLSDAVTHVALKIRECIKRGEPLHTSQKDDEDDEDGLLSSALIREAREAKETILETKKAMGAMFSSFAAKGSSFGSSLAAKSQSMRGTLSSAVGEGLSALAENVAPRESVGGEQKDDDEAEETEEKKPKGGLPDIGDEIDLSEEPWNNCIGMYSCKAIRRPEFVESAMEEAAAKKKPQEAERTSFATAGSMFSRFAQSAKSVMEETFLMITEEYIIEFKSNRLNIGSGTVTFSINIDKMAKLKFRREESLSLFFKEATSDPLVYMCLDSALAVQDIQSVLKRHGVKGKHTNAATQRAVQMALNMVGLIQQKEAELIDDPSVDRVNEIMDLYRQAAEKFEQAGDPRHAEVMAHMKRFLNQAFTTSILDGSYVKLAPAPTKLASSGGQSSPTSVPQGEILEQPNYNFSNEDDDDDDLPPTPTKPDKLNETFQEVDDLMTEAKKDMVAMGLDNSNIDTILNSPPAKSEAKDDKTDDDDFAELNAMFEDADKELNDLLNS